MRHSLGLREWLTLSSLGPVLVRAQYEEVRRKLPFLYAMVSLNVSSLAYVHSAKEPKFLTIWFPTALCIASLFRFAACLLNRTGDVSADRALYLLRRTSFITFLLSISYFSWIVMLAQHGSERDHVTVALFIVITVIGSLFCFTHLPQAAVFISSIAFMPFVVVMLYYGDTLFDIVAVNMIFVLGIVMAMLNQNYSGFKNLILLQCETDRLNREITAIANTDTLTGLPNRRMFFLEVNRMIEDRNNCSGHLAMGLIDLDGFKAVNDTNGHLVGDCLLVEVGARLKAIFASAGIVARLGGDEFAFVIQNEGIVAQTLGNAACGALRKPFQIGDITIEIGGSCGIDVWGDDSRTANDLYIRADSALYTSKTHQRGAATMFELHHVTSAVPG